MQFIVDVTDEDIDQGTSGAFKCMVARAMKRCTGMEWQVGYSSMVATDQSGTYNLVTPRLLGRIASFDLWKNGCKDITRPEPFSFEVSLPDSMKFEAPAVREEVWR